MEFKAHNFHIRFVFRIRILISVVIALCFVSTAAMSEQTKRQLRVGHNDFRPFVFTGENGQPRGYSIDLLTAIAKREGYRLEFIPADGLANMLEMFARGELDVLPILAQTQEREAMGVFTQSIGEFSNNLIVLEDAATIDPARLAGLRIGAVQASGAARTASTLKGVSLSLFDTNQEMLVALLSGQIDAVVAATEAFMSVAKSSRLDHRLTVIDPPLTQRPRGFLINAQLPDVLSDFNRIIASPAFRAEEKTIHERWFGVAGLGRPRLGAGWIAAGSVVLLIAALASLVSIRHRRQAVRLRKELTVAQHMADALEKLDVLVTIFDQNMRPIIWNEALPDLSPGSGRGRDTKTSFVEMLADARINGVLVPALPREDAYRHALGIAERMRAGEVVRRIVRGRDGRVFEACDARVGPNIFASVRSDVTVISEQSDIIEAQKRELEERNQQLEAFVNVAAHDLRAPLRHAMVSAQWLKEDIEERYGTLPDDLADTIDTIEHSALRMTRLIDDLLAYGLAGKLVGDPVEFSLEAAVARAVALAGIPAEAVVEVSLDRDHIALDQTAFETVMRNLVANAVKHHDKDYMKIDIRAFVDGNDAVFEVEDDGPGIPEEFRERIFEAFEKLKSKDQIEGNGLGLSFVKKTVQAWGGRVDVTSRGPRGSIFRFTAPLPERTGSDLPDSQAA